MSLSFSSVTSVHGQSGAPMRRIGGVDKGQILPAAQLGGSVFLPTFRTLASTFPSNIFSSARKSTSLLPKIDFLKHVLLRVDIDVASAPVTLVPCNYWFTQKEWRDSAKGTVFHTEYDDTAQAAMFARASVGQQHAIFKTTNVNSSANGKYGLANELPVGRSTFFIPMLASISENMGGLYLADLDGDLALDLTTPSTIISSGSGTISSTISFVVEGASVSDVDAKIYRNRYKLHDASARYLQPIRTEFLNKTLTAASSNNFLPINNVDGLCSHQILIVRPTSTVGVNTAFAQWRMHNIGDANGAGIDLVTSSGGSLWGNGSPVPTRHIRQHQSVDHFQNDFVSQKPLYYISYTDSINGALAGRISGGYKFKSTAGDQLRLTLPAAPVQEVQTMTQSGAGAAAGWYRLRFRDEESAQLLGNATVAQMKAAFEAMKSVQSKSLTVTFSATASAGASFTATFVDPEGTLDGDLVEVIPGDAFAASSSSARTTAGVPGLATGQFDIVVYSFVYSIANYTGTQLESRLMLV